MVLMCKAGNINLQGQADTKNTNAVQFPVWVTWSQSECYVFNKTQANIDGEK